MQDATKRSVKRTACELQPFPANGNISQRLTVLLSGLDVLHAAAWLHDKHHQKIGVHNFFDEPAPRFGFVQGSKSRQASIFIHSTLLAHLRPEMYQTGLNRNELVYSAEVVVFSLNATRLLTCREQFTIDVISSSAPYNPDTYPKRPEPREQQHYVSARDYRLMADKLESVLNNAVLAECHSLVLGAFGCGGAKNPHCDVARILRDILRKRDWPLLRLELVVIAIPSTKAAWPTFVSAFKGDENAKTGPYVHVDHDGAFSFHPRCLA